MTTDYHEIFDPVRCADEILTLLGEKLVFTWMSDFCFQVSFCILDGEKPLIWEQLREEYLVPVSRLFTQVANGVLTLRDFTGGLGFVWGSRFRGVSFVRPISSRVINIRITTVSLGNRSFRVTTWYDPAWQGVIATFDLCFP